jgi:L-malate glycosyltransferase
MKIIFLSTMYGYSWGGSELLWVESAGLAVRQGHEVVAVINYAVAEAPQLVRIRSLGVGLIRRPREMARRISRAYERYASTFRTVARFDPDVMLINLGSAYDSLHDLELTRFLGRSGTPYVVLCQHCPEHQILRPEFRERALRFYRGARRVAFVAERNRRALEQQLAGEIPGARVVRNPVNLDSLDEVPWPGRGPAGLACVARLDANFKGQDVLFEVLGGEPWRGRDWALRLYGEGPHRDYLAALARFRGIEDRTEFRGHVRDIRSIWAENHLALFPSRSEGTPLALVEAMACGRPVVASDVGGNAEWVAEPDSGFLAESSSAPSFGPALERAWLARGRWEEIGREARQVAFSQIDPSAGHTLLELVIDSVGGVAIPFGQVCLG